MKLYNVVEVAFRPINHMFPGSGFNYKSITLTHRGTFSEYYIRPPIYTSGTNSKYYSRIWRCINYTSSIIMWIMYICFLELTVIKIINSSYLLSLK
jgi:hypothetical protein